MSTVNNVSAAKPKVGGAISIAELTATLPTTATSELTGFTSLGYTSEDGLENSNSPESDTSKAWGGDTVLKVQTGKHDRFKFKLIEVLNVDVLKFVYGAANVSGALATGITVHVTAGELPAKAFVVDMIMREGVLKRIVIPHGEITEIGNIVYKDNEIVGYEITIEAMPDSSGNFHHEYIKSAGT